MSRNSGAVPFFSRFILYHIDHSDGTEFGDGSIPWLVVTHPAGRSPAARFEYFCLLFCIA